MGDIDGPCARADVVKSNKYTVLYFYNQDFSQGCSIEAERFNQALGEFEKRKAQASGASSIVRLCSLPPVASRPHRILLHHFRILTHNLVFRSAHSSTPTPTRLRLRLLRGYVRYNVQTWIETCVVSTWWAMADDERRERRDEAAAATFLSIILYVLCVCVCRGPLARGGGGEHGRA